MALQKCSECGEIVSDQAEKCPKCGYRQKRQRLTSGILFLFVIGAILIAVGTYNSISYYNMRTSVHVPLEKTVDGHWIGGENVNNIGLMEERRNGLTVNLFLLGTGLAISLACVMKVP